MADDSFDTEDFLAHHGVLGQKWGVRNDQSKAREDLSKSTKSKNGAVVRINPTKDTEMKKSDKVVLEVYGGLTLAGAGALYGQEAYGAVTSPLYKKRVEEDLKTIQKTTATIDKGNDFLRNEVDTKINTGTVFHRVASYKETEVNAAKYATYIDEDVLRYRHSWITPGRTQFHAHYATQLEATKDLKIASPESILQTIEDGIRTVLGDGETLQEKIYKAYDQKYKPEDLLESAWDPKYRKDLARELANRVVDHNRSNIWADDVGRATAELMQKAGYSAATDINNTGDNARKHAVVLFDKDAFKVTSHRLRQGERFAAYLANNRLQKAAFLAAGKII